MLLLKRKTFEIESATPLVKGDEAAIVARAEELHGEHCLAVEGGVVAEVEREVVVLHVDRVGDLRLHGKAAQKCCQQGQYPLYSSHIGGCFQKCKSTFFFRIM